MVQTMPDSRMSGTMRVKSGGFRVKGHLAVDGVIDAELTHERRDAREGRHVRLLVLPRKHPCTRKAQLPEYPVEK